MNRILTTVVLIIALVSPLNASRRESEGYEETNTVFKLHGKLSIWMGTPTFRIWIIGTNRILGVPGGDTEPAEMPDKLQKLFTNTSVEVYADFVVTPLTKYKKGHIQDVRIDSAENLVIYKDNKFCKKMKRL